MSRSEEFQKGHLENSIGLSDDPYTYTVTPAHANPFDETHVIGLHQDDKHLGTMRINPGGDVNWVEVKPQYRRQGHATRLWGAAKYLSQQFDNFPEPKHSWAQTPEGKKWAKSVGD
jgi:GNAT superfamily N-acetyltransferase